MAPHFVGFCQLVRRALLRWMAGSTPAAEEISAPSAAGRVSWRLTITVPSVWRRRVVIRTQVRRTVADRCPALVDAPRGEPGTDQMHGVIGQHRDPQVGRDATVALVPDRAKAEFGCQAAEGGLDVGDAPVRPKDRLDIPVDVAGAQPIGAGALIGLVV